MTTDPERQVQARGLRRARLVIGVAVLAAGSIVPSTAQGSVPPDDPSPSTTEPPPPDPDPIDPAAGDEAPPPETTTTEPAPAPLNQTVLPTQIAHILATIRYMESRGIYTLPPNKGNASGAYQFIGSTWAANGGFEHAYLAPPEVQDTRAAEDVVRFLARWNNDVSMIPVMWYYPIAATDPALMDIVPVPSAGNVLTVREYQTRWLGVFSTISGQPVQPLLFDTAPTPELGGPPIVPERGDDQPSISFPVLGPAQLAIPDCDAAEATDGAAARSGIEGDGLCTGTAPAIVFGAQMQPVLAVADGVVTEIVDLPGTTHPVSVTVTDTRGLSYVYSGFNDDGQGADDGSAPPHLRLSGLARLGATVRAGQILGFMGDTDPLPAGVEAPESAEGIPPHIRLTIFNLDGRALDSYGPVIDALFRQTCSLGTGPWSIPANGEGHTEVTIETFDSHPDIDSEWIITSSGQVTAAGWAALINPQDTCEFVPDEPYGPGGQGSAVTPPGWAVPLDLPTSMWVRLAIQTAGTAPDLFVRRG
jgi:hypothetical protein